MSNWKLIETAPKDGTKIQVYHILWKVPISVQWITKIDGDGKWIECTYSNTWHDECFTHWKEIGELPNPPLEQSTKEK